MNLQIKTFVLLVLLNLLVNKALFAKRTTIFLFTTPVYSAEEAGQRIADKDGVTIERVQQRHNSYTASIGVLYSTGIHWTVNGVRAEVLELVASRKVFQGLHFMRSVSFDEMQKNEHSLRPGASAQTGWGKSLGIIVFKEPQTDLDSALKAVADRPDCVLDAKASHIWFLDRYSYSMEDNDYVVKRGEMFVSLFLQICALHDLKDGRVRAVMTNENLTAAEFARRYSVDEAVDEKNDDVTPGSVEVEKELVGLIGEKVNEPVVSKEQTRTTTKATEAPQRIAMPIVAEDVWNVVIDPEADGEALKRNYSEAKDIWNFLKFFWQDSSEQERVILRSVASDLKSSAVLIKTRYQAIQPALD